VLSLPAPPATASPAEQYTGTHFGNGNLPAGCGNDVLVGNLKLVGIPNAVLDPKAINNVCHHMRTDMNGLDSPQVDVLVMLPLTPAAERDMRIMRQAVEMWEGGIDYLAPQMGLQWMADGVDFHITVDYFDPAGGDGGEFTTEPVLDPEIVVIGATNPVGGLGIGIDPVANVFVNPNGPLPCLPVDNPFDIKAWEALPGFNDHHAERSGTYNEDCGDAKGGQTGGNVCFAVNTALDPAPDTFEIVSLFDLVAHEFGHCMTVGHVGDGAEGLWNVNPRNDIMAYDDAPPGLNKCVSTLDVEGVATVMSRYLDVDGDGVAGNNPLPANDQAGQGGNPFQVQHPRDHLYASGTGSPMDCPQPDLGPVPGAARTDWTPNPVAPTGPVMTLSGPPNRSAQDGVFDVSGTVRRGLTMAPTDPGYFDDLDNDAKTPFTEIKELRVELTKDHLDATMTMVDVWPVTSGGSAVSYSLTVGDRTFDSFVLETGQQPRTFDSGGPRAGGGADVGAGYMPAGASTWDLVNKIVKFHIPRFTADSSKATDKDRHLASTGTVFPYSVSTSAIVGPLGTGLIDDRAPELNNTVNPAAPPASAAYLPTPPPVAPPRPPTAVATFDPRTHFQTFKDKGDPENTFFTEESTVSARSLVGLDSNETFDLDVTATSDVEFTLDWTDAVGGTDLDLHVTGAKSSGDAATGAKPEVAVLKDVIGTLNLELEPFLVADPLDGATYTLTAKITPNGPVGGVVDTDGDTVADATDQCPAQPGNHVNGCLDQDSDGVDDRSDQCPTEPGSPEQFGCPASAGVERVLARLGGQVVASRSVDTTGGVAPFSLRVAIPAGTHSVLLEWRLNGQLMGARTLTLTKPQAVTQPPPSPSPTAPPGAPGSGPQPASAPEPGSRPPGLTPRPEPKPEQGSTFREATLSRVQGNDRIDTAVSASRAGFLDGSAGSVVLARSDSFADGLAGASLGAAYAGPVLLTPRSGLDPRVGAELQRILPSGGYVFVLGGPAALAPDMETKLAGMGYSVIRIAGADRFETAVRVAQAQPRPQHILVATGQNFPDALAAGAAAGHSSGVVVLSDGPNLPASTANYLAANPGVARIAIGGPAAAAVPDAQPIVGPDRFTTSVMVAKHFFSAPRMVGLASGATFADALSGGPLLGRFGGPMLLTPPGELSPVVLNYLNRHRSEIVDLVVLGGERAVSRQVVDDALNALRG